MAGELARRRSPDDAIPPVFRVESRRDGDTVLVVPVGELDVATCPPVRAELESALDSGCTQLVVDLRPLTFMDSSGLHLLVTTQKAAMQRSIRFSLIRGPDVVSRALALAGLQDRFEFVTA